MLWRKCFGIDSSLVYWIIFKVLTHILKYEWSLNKYYLHQVLHVDEWHVIPYKTEFSPYIRTKCRARKWHIFVIVNYIQIRVIIELTEEITKDVDAPFVRYRRNHKPTKKYLKFFFKANNLNLMYLRVLKQCLVSPTALSQYYWHFKVNSNFSK